MNENQARSIVERLLDDEVRPGVSDDVVVVDAETVESGEWWVFVYNSVEHVRTGDAHSALAGNAPIMVNKATGEAHFGRTDITIDEQLHGRRPDAPSSVWQDVSEVFGGERDDDAG